MWKRGESGQPQQSAAGMCGPSLAGRPERQASVDRNSCSRLTSIGEVAREAANVGLLVCEGEVHGGGSYLCGYASPVSADLRLVEFPADDPERARRFWSELLDAPMEPRQEGQGDGWQTRTRAPRVGVHARGPGPGDTWSLPYFAVADLNEAVARVEALGGSVVHPGTESAICKDSEGSPFGLILAG
jgi:predicted enzyme related to lactoylglutathione lyase